MFVCTQVYRLLVGVLLCMASPFVIPEVGDVKEFSINEAIKSPGFGELVGNGVAFYFGDQQHPKISRIFGEYRANKKTNVADTSDVVACKKVFFSALHRLRERAIRQGGNAVINIHSNYTGNVSSSQSSYRCGAGDIIAAVALKGTVVRLE